MPEPRHVRQRLVALQEQAERGVDIARPAGDDGLGVAEEAPRQEVHRLMRGPVVHVAVVDREHEGQ